MENRYPEVTLYFESLEDADLSKIVNEPDEIAEEIYAMGDMTDEELEDVNGGILDIFSLGAAFLNKLKNFLNLFTKKTCFFSNYVLY